MQLFLDTASIDEVRAAARFGVISGVTTNPTLLAKEGGVSYRQRIREIASVIDGPISAECVTRSADELLTEARELASWHPNVVVKIPIDEAGLEAIHRCSSEGIRVNVTLIFSANQALLAALAGASYLSPFVGRLDDIGEDGIELVRTCVGVMETHGLGARVLAASLRHPLHVTQAALAGAHVATIPPSLLPQLLKHPLTDLGIQRFLDDAKKAGLTGERVAAG
ncbi:MAG: fructose-6-phosphate aldolase [Tepidiformaceae bacterium]